MSQELSIHKVRQEAYEIANAFGLHPGAAKAKVFALYDAGLRPCDVWARRHEFQLENLKKSTLYRYHQEFKILF